MYWSFQRVLQCLETDQQHLKGKLLKPSGDTSVNSGTSYRHILTTDVFPLLGLCISSISHLYSVEFLSVFPSFRRNSFDFDWTAQHSSPDPIASKAGHWSNAASFLHYHVDVCFHDFGDLSNLKENIHSLVTCRHCHDTCKNATKDNIHTFFIIICFINL